MVVGNGADILEKLMKLQSQCPNCETTLTFEDSARLAKDNGVSENAIMCHNCKKVFSVNILPNKMEILNELTKYKFSKENEKPKTAEVNKANIENMPPITTNQKQVVNQQPISTNPPKQNKSNGALDNIVNLLFFKTDAEYGLPRLSKTKIISGLWFILIFVIALIDSFKTNGYIPIIEFVAYIILGIILTIPVFVIGWIIARHNDNKAQAFQQQPNYQSNANVVSMPTRPTCPNCNMEIMEGAKFCPHCGMNLSNR
jgi:uncharacterized protein YbaR (Trm112 family)